MEFQEDIIVEISPERAKFFGCTGKMLIPCPATVAALLEEIPEGKLITTTLLRAELAARKNVQATCPPSTQKALKAVANDPACKAPYWRVTKPTGELASFFPGGSSAQAEKLKSEGIKIDSPGKTPKVLDFKSKLLDFQPRLQPS